jgi:hypothetical protein
MRQKKKKNKIVDTKETRQKKKQRYNWKKMKIKLCGGSDIYKKSDCLCILYGYAEQDKKIKKNLFTLN